MPITIKKPEFKPLDKKYRKWTVVTAFFSFALTVVLFVFLRRTGEAISHNMCMMIFSAYGLFLLSGMVTLKKAIDTYRYENNMPALFQSLLYAAIVVFCLLNLRFAVILLMKGLDKEDTAQKMLGSQEYKEFVLAQYSSWMCMLAGMTISMILGLLGGHKLLTHR